MRRKPNSALEIKAYERPRVRQAFSDQIRPFFLHSELVTAKRRYAYRPHLHNSYEIIIVTKGEYRCRLNQKELRLKPGSVLVIKPGDCHEDFCDKGLAYYEVLLALEICSATPSPKTIFADGVDHSLQCFVDGTGTTRMLVERMRNELESARRYHSFMVDAILEELFWHIVRSLPERAITPWFAELSRLNDFTNNLCRIFHASLDRSMTLREIAARLAISESHLGKQCRKLLGSSPVKAFAKYKMDYALRLLKISGLNVGEVSDRLGFKNQYHFSKVFKKHHHRAPSEFKSAAVVVPE